MPTTYALTQIGNGLLISGTDGTARYFGQPTITGAASSRQLAYRDGRINLIEFREGEALFVIGMSEITSIGGITPAGTLEGVFTQVVALLPVAIQGVEVATYADAVLRATGSSPKRIRVVSDEGGEPATYDYWENSTFQDRLERQVSQ